MTTITFGLHQNDADWSDSPAAIGEIHLGPEGMLSFLQTRLGLGGKDEPEAVRIDRYRKRMEAVNSSSVWFHESFKKDPLAAAKQLLSWRDELILAGWDGKALLEGSKRLDALSAIEKVSEPPLPPGREDKLLEVLAEIKYLDEGCIDTIYLIEPLDILPFLWQQIFKTFGGKIKEIPLQDACDKNTNLAILQRQIANPGRADEKENKNSFNEKDESLVLLETDTEWEAAEALAMWLAADTTKNDRVTMIVPGTSGALSSALHHMGLPRTGSNEPSKWRAHLQILPLVFANAWEPVDIGALTALLSLPISPIPSEVRFWLLRALEEEAGVKGKKWDEALVKIKEKYTAKGWKTDTEVGKMLKEIEEMLVSERFKPNEGIAVTDIIKRCKWILKHLPPQSEENEFLKKPRSQVMTLQQLVAGQEKKISRVELERMIDLLVTEESFGSTAEAAPWKVAAHPGGVTNPRPILIWWNFINQPVPAATYWNKTEREALKRARIILDEPGIVQKRETLAWKNAFLKAQQTVIMIRPKKLRGKDTVRHPLWDMITAFADSDKLGGKGAHEKFIRDVPGVFFTETQWQLAGRTGKTEQIEEAGWPKEHSYSIPEHRVKAKEHTSYSDMSSLIGCPLSWVLKYEGIYGHSTPGISRSLGNLCHSIAEDLFRQSPHWEPDKAKKKAEKLFDDKLESMAIELCAEDRGLDKIRYRREVGQAIHDLVMLINERGYTFKAVETVRNSTLCGVPFEGRLDMFLQDKQENPVVIDLKYSKWDGYKKAIKEGRDLQLASYSWLLEQTETAPYEKITAGYFLLPLNKWLDDDQETLRGVFSRATTAWQTELEKLDKGIVTKGEEKIDDPGSLFKLEATCTFCNYVDLCKISDIAGADTPEDEDE
ncbi:hypothetical protein AGMMS49944_19420 [Spirochaetia bacterium]|nr:hypothetical protein AGMMS49944_19420 [Spirochaetia bacterium]